MNVWTSDVLTLGSGDVSDNFGQSIDFFEKSIRARIARTLKVDGDYFFHTARMRTHDDNLIREFDRVWYEMVHHENGYAVDAPDSKKVRFERLSGDGIQIRKRFVNDEEVGRDRESSREADALTLSARERGRIMTSEMFEADLF